MEIAGGLLVLAAVGLIWTVGGSTRVLYPVRLSLSAVPSDFGLPWEGVKFSAADGTALSAWAIRHPDPCGLLLLLHGYGSSKAELLDVAGALYRAGKFSILLMDFRGHGESGAGAVGFGCREIQDVQAALEFISKDSGLKGLPLGCWGVSMGGAIALWAGVKFPQILGVVADSAYASVGKAIARAQWLTYHIPRVPLGQLVIWAVEFRLKCRMSGMDPIHRVGRIAPRALFLIHGGKDVTTPSSEGLELYRAAREPKAWWLVPEAEHATCYYDRAEEYVNKVTEFFQNVFLRTP